jgi:hypothetical protein
MNTASIITELEEQRDRIVRAIELLNEARKRPGRRPQRHLSAEARSRISEAQKKRWDAQKKK